MPLYEYECEKCGHRFEVIQKYSDPLVETCPKCGSPVRKLMSSPAIQFKGSGFYITDYAKKDSVTATKAGESAGASKDPSTDAKSETKSETKSEKKSETKTETKTKTES